MSKPEPSGAPENTDIEWLEKPPSWGGRVRALVGGVPVAGYVTGDPDAPNVLASLREAARRG